MKRYLSGGGSSYTKLEKNVVVIELHRAVLVNF